MKRQKSLCFLTFASLLLFGPTVLADETESIELSWKPTTTLGELGALDLTGLRNTSIRVTGFSDSRKQPHVIGKNVEDVDDDGDGVIHITADTSIAKWAGRHVAEVMRSLGARIDQKNGRAQLGAEIQRFFVTEGHTYKSDVALIFTLRNSAGAVLWEGLASGSATRFGRSLSDENYSEVLSDALQQAAYRLMSQPGFRAALAKTG